MQQDAAERVAVHRNLGVAERAGGSGRGVRRGQNVFLHDSRSQGGTSGRWQIVIEQEAAKRVTLD